MNNTVGVDICPLKINIHVDNIILIKGDGLFKLSSHIYYDHCCVNHCHYTFTLFFFIL